VNRDVAIIDTEVSPFGRHDSHSLVGCAAQVACRLLARHRWAAGRVGLVVVGSARPAKSDGRENGLAQSISEKLGLGTTSGLDVRAFCASGNVAIQAAVTSIESGRIDAALAIGVDHVLGGQPGGSLVPEATPEAGQLGYSPPVFYALCADRYLANTNLPVEVLAAVAVHNRAHAADNPNAAYRSPLTLEEVLDSRQISSPLTKLQCCPSADGAGAALIVATDALSSDPDAGRLLMRGMGGASNPDLDRSPLTTYREDVVSAEAAFREAGVGPSDIEVAEVHDAFTISQIIHLEDVGLAPRGEGWRHAAELNFGPVVNPNGGLLSRGHPMGATGLAQVDSIRRYFAAARREGNPRWGLIQEAGGLELLGQMLSTTFVVEWTR
jgi:acetyl-CoA acetyltransferase